MPNGSLAETYKSSRCRKGRELHSAPGDARIFSAYIFPETVWPEGNVWKQAGCLFVTDLVSNAGRIRPGPMVAQKQSKIRSQTQAESSILTWDVIRQQVIPTDGRKSSSRYGMMHAERKSGSGAARGRRRNRFLQAVRRRKVGFSRGNPDPE